MIKPEEVYLEAVLSGKQENLQPLTTGNDHVSPLRLSVLLITF